jgi:hypothetical protein
VYIAALGNEQQQGRRKDMESKILDLFVPGIRIVRWPALGIEQRSDPRMKFEMSAHFNAPDMERQSQRFRDTFGTRQLIVVQGEMQEDLELFAQRILLLSNPRLRGMTITDSRGEVIKSWRNRILCEEYEGDP